MAHPSQLPSFHLLALFAGLESTFSLLFHGAGLQRVGCRPSRLTFTFTVYLPFFLICLLSILLQTV
ncbi:hypothetical protein SCHPADRAFT_901603 [Schizopora paradoxa]|uniref:Uncharacterized protein n=1 Tax=Schizopora paradoxa TaxID=27342 RepID=A0A0H2RWE1_9AGAM|nr:hypothetical protein SCHPADRAFT_901603 [Schizopora paradoxa]